VLDAGRQYEERMNAATTALTAEVERLREERDEFERRYSTVLRNLNVAQQERDRLRAGIEALAGDPTAQDETGTWIDRKRVADLLAGSGEQPGCPCYDTGGNYGVCAEHAEDPTPVAPVYETIRAFIEEEVGFDGGPGMDDQARRLTDRVLAAVGQGVTAEQAWDEGLRAGEAVERARWQWSAGATARAVNGLTERPERPANPYRAAVRPTGQEQS